MSRAIVGRHALINGKFFTAINETTFPDFSARPEAAVNPATPGRVFSAVREFNWIPHPFFTLPLSPVGDDIFDTPLLQCLNWYPQYLPILYHRRRNGWRLREDLVHTWRALEVSLLRLVKALLSVTNTGYGNARPFPPPAYFRYELFYPTQVEARLSATNSIHAFRPLLGLVTYAFLRINERFLRLGKAVGTKNWRDIIAERYRIHFQLIADVESSVCGSPTARRLGGILDMTLWTEIDIIPLYCHVNAPIYLYWGSAGEIPLRIPSILEKYCPRDRQLRLELQQLSTQLPPPPVLQTVPIATLPHAAAPPSPLFAVERNSRQRPGEHWRDYFIRQAKENELRAANESPEKKAARLAKLEHARRNLQPGKKGALAFHWVERDGNRIRKPGGRPYDHLWDDAYRNKRRYDSHKDEWDICTEFDPEDCMPPGEGENDDADDFYDPANDPFLSFNLDQLEVDSPIAAQADQFLLAHNHDIEFNVDRQLVFLDHTLSPMDFAFHRYGIIPYTQPPPKRARVESNLSRFLGHGQFNKAVWGTDAEWSWLEIHLASLISPTPSQHLVGVCDASDRSSLVCAQIGTKFHLWTETVAGTRYYFLRPSTPSPHYPTNLIFSLSSPVDVFEVLRRPWGNDLTIIAGELSSRAIHFKPCLESSTMPHLDEVAISICRGLGYRPINYKPDNYDFRAYEAIRDSFLRSSRGQLALYHGGLVTRIALDVIDVDTSIVPLAGHLRAIETSQSKYWHNQLSEDEIELICGVYHVDTGVKNNATNEAQTSWSSWWPMPNIWEKGFMSIGFWSRDCEAWYANRLMECRGPSPFLRTATGWRKLMTGLQRSVLRDYKSIEDVLHSCIPNNRRRGQQ